jgi:hypothetical protein
MAYARDEDGDEVCPIDHEAVRFCAIGAIVRAYRICTGHYDHDWELRGIPGKTLDRLEDISEEKGHAAVTESLRQTHQRSLRGASIMLYDPRWNKKSLRWRKILCDAADLIEERGWAQFEYFDGYGYCIHGAINKVTKGQKYQRRKAKAQLREMLGVEWLPEWNDMPGRTKAQVLAAMRVTALHG